MGEQGQLLDRHYPGDGRKLPTGVFVYVLKPAILEWAKDNDIDARPDVRMRDEPKVADNWIQHSIVVQDDVAAVLFKLKWC